MVQDTPETEEVVEPVAEELMAVKVVLEVPVTTQDKVGTQVLILFHQVVLKVTVRV